MMRARILLVGAVVAALTVGSAEAAADPAAPTPTSPSAAAPASPAPSTAPSTDGDVVVLHTDTGADARSTELHAAIDRLGATVRHTFGDQKTISLELPAGTSSTAPSTTDTLAELPGVAAVEPPVTRTFDAVPNDPQLPGQRSYLDAVAAPAAWNRQHGSPAVRIAVIDSGVDVTHPDLRTKIAGRYNAVTGSTSVTDTVGHGTFVAGVAAADTGNGVGVAGAGYDTDILAVKVADSYGDIAVDDEIAGIRWAADHGATIINLSLSGPDSSTAELRAVQYAQRKGVLIVAAAGNDGNTARQYPAAYPGVIAVGATDVAKRRRASFSGYGSWVTLAAPGVNVLSTAPRAGSDYFPGRSGYARGDGTSFSTPLVAGAAALLAAQNRALTATQLRAALVASAHGYTGSGLGRGQVDFALALDHVTPPGTPSSVTTTGTSGTVTLRATSTAARVSFRVDAGPWLTPVTVTSGAASLPFSSYGYANASHTVSAVDCSTYGECNTAHPRRSEPFTLDNAAPGLDVASRVSGPFRASGSASGGGLRLLIDGRQAGFDATAPYSFGVNGSLYDNRDHTLAVQTCTASGSLCAGPTSAAATVTFDSLHPTITGLSRTAISPNGDGSGDTARLTFRTDDPTDHVTVETRTAAGATVSSDSVVTGAPYVWRGIDASGHRLPDGNYRLVVLTTSNESYPRYGSAERSVVVDTRAPRLSGLTGNDTRFFPYRDGYRDSFAPTASLPDGGALALTITTASGRLVRTLQTVRGPVARVAAVWNGRTAAGRQVSAGLYHWTFTASDAAGNVTRSATYRVRVDSRRLRTRTVSVVRHAKTKVYGTARCASKSHSRYKRGAHLTNRCRGGSDDIAYAAYTITVPTALRYTRLTFAAYGRAARKSRLSASFNRSDGGLEVPRSVRVTRSSSRWRTVAAVPAAGHIGHGKVHVALLLSSRYAGTNDFDARSVRLRVTLVQLG